MRVLGPKGLLIIIELTDEGVKMVRETYRMHPDVVDPRDYVTDLNLQVEITESKYLNAYMYRKKPE